MTRLLNNLKAKISGSDIFLNTAKEMWDTLKVMYENDKNPSRIFEIYERLFKLKLLMFYNELKSLIDELDMHQPAITDAATLRGYRQDLAVSKFLSGMYLSLRS